MKSLVLAFFISSAAHAGMTCVGLNSETVSFSKTGAGLTMTLADFPVDNGQYKVLVNGVAVAGSLKYTALDANGIPLEAPVLFYEELRGSYVYLSDGRHYPVRCAIHTD